MRPRLARLLVSVFGIDRLCRLGLARCSCSYESEGYLYATFTVFSVTYPSDDQPLIRVWRIS